MRLSFLRTPLLCGCVLASVLLGLGVAEATHFRYGHPTFQPDPMSTATVEVTLQNAWRGDAYTTSNGRCIDPATLTSIACTGPGGVAGVGDVIVEFQGFSTFDWGDGSPQVGSPLGPLMYEVTSIDADDNWLFGLALDPDELPAVDTTLQHTFAGAGDQIAAVDSCCRISAVAGNNEHINNPDGRYRAETEMDVGSGNRSPVSSLPPIVLCPIDALCEFLVPGSDPDGDSLSFRLSTSDEASGVGGSFVQPGPPHAPNAASIDPVTGLYSWDTTGATLAVVPGNNTLYSTQVMLEDGDSRSAIDFLIQLVEEDPAPPDISSPVCETTQVVTTGNTLTFTVDASDPDPEDVTLNVAGLPSGAVMTPTLPVTGNPVASDFAWTPDPSQVGIFVVNFFATSTSGGQSFCPVTLDVTDVMEVGLDIKPWSFPNSINTKSNGNIPVAVLSSAEFDAPTEVDSSSLTFGASGDEDSFLFCGEAEDADGDGLLDLVCHFDTQSCGFVKGDTEGVLRGNTFDGVAIEGVDSVRIVR